jgi:hypothetical protein
MTTHDHLTAAFFGGSCDLPGEFASSRVLVYNLHEQVLRIFLWRFGLPYLYWVARREAADASRLSMARALWRWTYPDTPDQEPPRFDSWCFLLIQMARMIGDQPVIVIFDEFPRRRHRSRNQLVQSGLRIGENSVSSQ